MSVSLAEVIQAGGYNLATVEDARWLVGKQSEFEELVEFCQNVIEESEAEHSRFDPDHYSECQPCYEDHLDFMQEQADDARLDAMSEAVENEE